MSAPAARVSPARVCAYAVVRRVFEQGAYADRALEGEARGLDPRDRALATRIAYGAVQRRATLDHVAESLAGRPVGRLDPAVRAALRTGLTELLYSDHVAPHAVVGDSVELAKRAGSRGAGLVNAVLRRAAGEGRAIADGLGDATPAQAALRHSVPLWLADLWFAERGPDEARALLAVVNEPAEHAIRVNTLRASVESVLGALPVAARPAAGIPEGLVLDGAFDVHGSPLFRSGRLMAQSRGSMAVARALSPEAGASVLDLCAAPGGKTTHLAALSGSPERVTAVERHPGRAAALRATCARMGASGVRVEVADAAALRPPRERYPFVLADPPCSGLGTLSSRPDLRWRTTPERIAELAVLQRRILDAAVAATEPGGVLVYSVCTISRAESEAVVDAALAASTDLRIEWQTQLLPHRDGTDGFYIARLRRG